MKLDQHFAVFGFQVRDRVTGFTGVVTSISFDLYGCVQAAVTPAAVTPPDKAIELPDGRWFDTKRLEKIGEAPVMDLPTFEIVPGGAAKPAYAEQPRK